MAKEKDTERVGCVASSTPQVASVGETANTEREDAGLAPGLSPRHPDALEQIDAGLQAVQTYLARTSDVVDRPTARLAREVMVLLAATSVSESEADALFVRQVHAAVFTKRMLYWLLHTRVTETLRALETLEGSEVRSRLLERMQRFLVTLDPAFTELTVERLDALLRQSSVAATGGPTHGPAYTSAAISLAVNAFGQRARKGETKWKAAERVAKLFRQAGRPREPRPHKR
jgi:hypothetical protein